jgi:hypothetical protein
VANLDRLGKIAAWFQADNQGRTNEEPAVWGCALPLLSKISAALKVRRC